MVCTENMDGGGWKTDSKNQICLQSIISSLIRVLVILRRRKKKEKHHELHSRWCLVGGR
jgi:hypothetical protein